MMKEKRFPYRRSTLLVLSLLLVIAVAGCSAAGSLSGSRGATPDAIETDLVSDVVISDSVEASGTVKAAQEAVLTWKTSGVVSKVYTEAGTTVKAGDVLAELDLTSVSSGILASQTELITAQQALDNLEPTALAIVQAEQRIAAVKDDVRDKQRIVDGLGTASRPATIEQANATVTLAKIQLDNAWDDYKPYQNKPESNKIRAALYNKWAEANQKYDQAVIRLNNLKGTTVNQTDLDLAQANLDLAEASLADAEQNLAELKAGADPQDVAAAEARITAANANLATIRITAPFDGEILVVDVQEGDVVNTGQSAFTLADRSLLHVDTLIDELDIHNVQVGDPVELTLDSMPGETLTGMIGFINPMGQKVAGNVKYVVRVDLEPVDFPVLLEATADVIVTAGEPRDVVTVPVRAIQIDNAGEYVNVITSDGSLKRIDVMTGQLLGGKVVILSDGLTNGDRVQLVTSNEMADQMQQMNFMSGGQ